MPHCVSTFDLSTWGALPTDPRGADSPPLILVQGLFWNALLTLCQPSSHSSHLCLPRSGQPPLKPLCDRLTSPHSLREHTDHPAPGSPACLYYGVFSLPGLPRRSAMPRPRTRALGSEFYQGPECFSERPGFHRFVFSDISVACCGLPASHTGTCLAPQTEETCLQGRDPDSFFAGLSPARSSPAGS